MKRPLVALSLLILIALSAAVLPATKSVQAGNSSAAAGTLGEAGEYCVNHGGEVDTRKPYFNTNDAQQNWFALAGDRQFCKFTNKDTSRIHVLL